MKIVLRIISALSSLAVILNLLMVVQFVYSCPVKALLSTDIFWIWTAFGWVLILMVGPVVAVQLWRLKPMGRLGGMILFAHAAIYCSLGAYFFGGPDMNVSSVTYLTIFNVIGFLILYSRAAKRVCDNEGKKIQVQA